MDNPQPIPPADPVYFDGYGVRIASRWASYKAPFGRLPWRYRYPLWAALGSVVGFVVGCFILSVVIMVVCVWIVAAIG